MQFLSSLNIRYRHIHLKETDGGKRVNKSMCKCLIDYWEIFWMTCIIHWIFMENFRYVYLRQDNKIGEGFRSFVWNYSMEELLLLFSNLCLWYLSVRERERKEQYCSYSMCIECRSNACFISNRTKYEVNLSKSSDNLRKEISYLQPLTNFLHLLIANTSINKKENDDWNISSLTLPFLRFDCLRISSIVLIHFHSYD